MKVYSKIIFALVALAVLLLVNAVLAGEAGTVSCSTPGCGYHTKLIIGGGIRTPAITGYCSKEKKFVSIKLKGWEDYHKAHYCPGGQERLQPIYDGADVSRIPCPKCGNMTLKYQRTFLFD